MRRDADIEALKRIAQMLIDVRTLQARAARLCEDADIVAELEQIIGDRSELLEEIEEQVRELGGALETTGSFAGAAHKAFFNLRLALDRDEHVALASVSRSETRLIEEIRRRMRQRGLGAETRAFLGLVLDRVLSGRLDPPSRPERNGHEQRA